MATIRPNDNAPDEQVKYCLGSVDFDLGPGDEYQTDDRAAIADASAHPWLEVEVPQVQELSEARASRSVPYEDDVLAAVNSEAFNFEKIKAEQEARAEVIESPVAIQAGLDQGKPVEEGGVAVTLAADNSDEKTDKKMSAKESK